MRGQIHDQRFRPDGEPWSMHRMDLEIEIDLADTTITRARSTMHDYPHAECPTAESSVQALEGLSVARGFTRAARERIGGPLGCDHVAHLVSVVAPAAIQALGGLRSRRAATSGESRIRDDSWWERLRNSCHIWADGGVGQQKVEIGWQPSGDYPAPSLDELRRR